MNRVQQCQLSTAAEPALVLYPTSLANDEGIQKLLQLLVSRRRIVYLSGVIDDLKFPAHADC